MGTEGTGAVPSRELGQGARARFDSTYVDDDTSDKWRRLVIRIFWDGEEHPSIEVPLDDFFCNGWVDVWTFEAADDVYSSLAKEVQARVHQAHDRGGSQGRAQASTRASSSRSTS